MNCKLCGKQTENEAIEYCFECAQRAAGEGQGNQENYQHSPEQNQQYQQNYEGQGYAPQYAPPPPPMPQDNYIMFGFGKALTSAILAFFNLYLAIFSMMFSALGVEEMGSEGGLIGLILALISIGLGVMCLIFGIQSIKRFVSMKKMGIRKKPYVAFIIGIHSVVFSGIVLLLDFIAVLLALASFAI